MGLLQRKAGHSQEREILQEKYKQQQAEMIARIEAREAAEKQAQQASQTEAASEVAP